MRGRFALGGYLAISGLWLSFGCASAATPCDFKGLSVGDKMTPQQIMNHFGIAKFAIGDPPESAEQRQADFDERIKRAKVVSLLNAAEEEDEREGPKCSDSACRIPYGRITVGNEPYPMQVGAFVAFGKDGVVTEIDVSFSKSDWDDVIELMGTKYGANWKTENTDDFILNYETKRSTPVVITTLEYRTPGTNPKTGDHCKITAGSQDTIYVHTTSPLYRAQLVISLMSKNF